MSYDLSDYIDVSMLDHPDINLNDEGLLAYTITRMRVGTMTDNVNHPAHYGQGQIEAITYIHDFLNDEEYIGYLRGNIAKYMHRWRYKNGVEDLKKARWYLDRLIELEED